MFPANLQQRVDEMLDSGMSRDSVMETLRGTPGVQFSELKDAVAHHVDWVLLDKYGVLIDRLVFFLLIQVLLSIGVVAFFTEPDYTALLALTILCVKRLFFALNFSRNHAPSYNWFLLWATPLSLVCQVLILWFYPVWLLLAIVVQLISHAWVWYIRGKLFPDLK